MNIFRIFAILLVFSAQAPVLHFGFAEWSLSNIGSESGSESDYTESESDERWVRKPPTPPSYPSITQEQIAQIAVLTSRIGEATQYFDRHATIEQNIFHNICDNSIRLKELERSLQHVFPGMQIEPLTHRWNGNLRRDLSKIQRHLSSGYSLVHLDRLAEGTYYIDHFPANSLNPASTDRHPQEAQLIEYIEQNVERLDIIAKRSMEMLNEIVPSLAALKEAESRIAALYPNTCKEAELACLTLEGGLWFFANSRKSTALYDIDAHAMSVIERDIQKIGQGAEIELEGNAEEYAARLEEVVQKSVVVAALVAEVKAFAEAI
jgi:hypothetical protein